jgi:hypothetical protein
VRLSLPTFDSALVSLPYPNLVSRTDLGEHSANIFSAGDPTGADSPAGKRFRKSAGPQGLRWRTC